ncbi:hypothetical protein EHM69_01080 [candidate division KSB1 bacterium]|nr:MAG: hypothetical protein EHM69_01080 [candidate division KSB1 bacterium]
MSKDVTLKRVEDDIIRGDLGKARDRLHGLIASYPEDLSLRTKLAQIYWKLQYPAMAGRYWYLDSDSDEIRKAAIAIYECAYKHNAFHILHGLRIRFDPSILSDVYAKQRIESLAQQCSMKWGGAATYSYAKQKAFHIVLSRKEKLRGALVGIMVLAVVISLVILLIMGIFHLIGLLSHH